MRKTNLSIIIFSLIGIFALSQTSHAYWIWTPQTKKFINPKNAVKDTPKEQFDWAMSFYNAKDYQRAAFEFDKLAKQYEFSDYASRAQYYVGLCYENTQKYYTAFESYQKAIDNFPHLANMDEVLARQYAIGMIYLEKASPKVLGNDIMAPLDRAVEIFKKVVENAPYGKHAEDAQLKLGEALKKSERYEEAVQAYHKIVDDYPNSKFATKAMYEEAYCAYKASLEPAYDSNATNNAIKTFEKFVDKNKDTGLTQEAVKTMKRLKDNVSEKSFETAQFYEARGKTEAAIIYYQDIIDTYPDSPFADKAKIKIEELKSKGNKKAPGPLDFNKKKPKPVAREARTKKPWKPLSFFGAKKEETKKSPEIPAVEIPVAQIKKEEPLAAPAEAPKSEPAVQAIEAPKPEPAAQAVESPAIKPDTEAIEAPKKEEAVLQAQETPKQNSWEPLNFETKKEPVVKEAPKSKAWKPLNFDAKKEPVVKEVPKKKPWKPLSFFGAKKEETKKSPEIPAVEIPVTQIKKEEPPAAPAAETPKSEPVVQAIEAPKPEPAAQAVESPAIKPDTETIESPKKEEEVLHAQETPKQKSWKPLNFETKKEPVVKEAPKNKAWKPLNFDAKKEPVVKEILEKKSWRPLRFDTKISEEAGGWKPLNFGKK